MRLVDLDPRWLVKDGQRVGFIFKSPANPAFWQSCFLASPPRREQWALFVDALKGDDEDRGFGCSQVQGCSQGTHWTIAPEIATADFNNLTVRPSLDGSAGGLWHGFITDGQIA